MDVTLNMESGEKRTVCAHVARAGLAVTQEACGFAFRVTHIGSGWGIGQYDTLAAARAAFDALLPLADWTLPADTLRQQRGLGRKVSRAVRGVGGWYA